MQRPPGTERLAKALPYTTGFFRKGLPTVKKSGFKQQINLYILYMGVWKPQNSSFPQNSPRLKPDSDKRYKRSRPSNKRLCVCCGAVVAPSRGWHYVCIPARPVAKTNPKLTDYFKKGYSSYRCTRYLPWSR